MSSSPIVWGRGQPAKSRQAPRHPQAPGFQQPQMCVRLRLYRPLPLCRPARRCLLRPNQNSGQTSRTHTLGTSTDNRPRSVARRRVSARQNLTSATPGHAGRQRFRYILYDPTRLSPNQRRADALCRRPSVGRDSDWQRVQKLHRFRDRRGARCPRPNRAYRACPASSITVTASLLCASVSAHQAGQVRNARIAARITNG